MQIYKYNLQTRQKNNKIFAVSNSHFFYYLHHSFLHLRTFFSLAVNQISDLILGFFSLTRICKSKIKQKISKSYVTFSSSYFIKFVSKENKHLHLYLRLCPNPVRLS